MDSTPPAPAPTPVAATATATAPPSDSNRETPPQVKESSRADAEAQVQAQARAPAEVQASAPRAAPSRRPHHKSRLGCAQCKQRKVKCDEAKPSCLKCLRHQTPCSFLELQPFRSAKDSKDSPSSSTGLNLGSAASTRTSPSPSLATSVQQLSVHPQTQGDFQHFSLLDLELLHFYTTSTWSTISTLEIWQVAIPAMGFEYPFVLHELLAVSALHLARLSPHRRTQLLRASERHHQIALPQFREAISNINQQNCHACSAFSMVLNVYAWASPDRPGNLFLVDLNPGDDDHSSVELVKILRGGNLVFRGARDWVAQGPLWSLLKPWVASGWNRDPNNVEPIPGQNLSANAMAAQDEARLAKLSVLWETPGSQVPKEQADVFDMTSKFLRKVFLLSVSDNGIEIIQVVLSWPIMIPDIYISLVQSRNPHALVLLAHYCILLKRVSDRWWIQGRPEHLLWTIRRELGPAWEPWIEWPLQEVGIKVG